MIINNNLTSLSALNAVNVTDKLLKKSIQPLATGLKINSAADDASGLAISEKMRSQIGGYDMAVKNAQDGLSMLRTAEGGLSNTNDLLHRMRELTVQASNDVLTAEDRVHIQEEIEELKNQINHISDYTNFNTKKLLDGTHGAFWSSNDKNLRIRVKGSLVSVDDNGTATNYEADYRIEAKADPGALQIQKSNIMDINYSLVSEAQNLKLVQGDGKITGINLYSGDTLNDIAKKINDAIAFDFGQANFTDDANKFSTLVYDSTDTDKVALIVRSAVQGREGEIYFAGNEELLHSLGFYNTQNSSEGCYDVSIYNIHSGEAVVSDLKITGNELKGIIHSNVDIDFSPMSGLISKWNEKAGKYILSETGTYTANIHLANNGVTFQVGTNQSENFSVQFSNVSSESLGVEKINVMTPELASRSITILDEAIDDIVKQRTQIVSYENSLEHSIANLASSGTNLVDSRSRITDADYAKSAMRFIEFQILSKAEQAMLVQANQQPEAVFSLMGVSEKE